MECLNCGRQLPVELETAWRKTQSSHSNSAGQRVPRSPISSFTQAAIDSSKNPTVLMPCPFYQIYEGAAIMAEPNPFISRQLLKTTL